LFAIGGTSLLLLLLLSVVVLLLLLLLEGAEAWDLGVKPLTLGRRCSRLVAWAASGINRQMVSHVLKNGRIRRGSYVLARNFITAFFAAPRPFIDSFGLQRNQKTAKMTQLSDKSQGLQGFRASNGNICHTSATCKKVTKK
jgi:hypothetical protein